MTNANGASCRGCSSQSGPPDPLEVGEIAPDLPWRASDRMANAAAPLRGSLAIVAFLGDDWDPARDEFIGRYQEALVELSNTADGEDRVDGVQFAGGFFRVGFADRTELRTALVRERDLPADAAVKFGVAGKRAVFVIDAVGTVRWRFVAPAAGYPQPGSVREALRSALRPTTPTKHALGISITRRDFVATALAAALAFSLLPTGERPAAAQEPGGTPAGKAAAAIGLPVTLQINGSAQTLTLDPRVTLLDALREYAGLYGSKKGCDHGQCGACTVHIEGRRINSCLTLAVTAQGKSITTIEGLAQGDMLHPMQEAFLKHDGFQCGYCTPGQIMSAVALINEGHATSRGDIRELMSGNICRCGAYPNIVDAVDEVRTGMARAAASSQGERSDAAHVSV